MEIIDIFVDKFYQMDPQFEDLLPTGYELKDGMMVLIEESLIRETTQKYGEAGYEMYQLDRLRENNRWCTVSHIDIDTYYDEGSKRSIVTFIATYPDGTKRKRRYSTSYAWIVKLDTIPVAPKEQ